MNHGSQRPARSTINLNPAQVAERWVRATDEEDAAEKVKEEFRRP
ncbi:hypothetical protein ACWIB8_11840 [Corynebacterium flavescens]